MTVVVGGVGVKVVVVVVVGAVVEVVVVVVGGVVVVVDVDVGPAKAELPSTRARRACC